jgi:hypothetical protein
MAEMRRLTAEAELLIADGKNRKALALLNRAKKLQEWLGLFSRG